MASRSSICRRFTWFTLEIWVFAGAGFARQGLDVVARVARVPTYAPLESARTWNGLAQALGDDRARRARPGSSYGSSYGST